MKGAIQIRRSINQHQFFVTHNLIAYGVLLDDELEDELDDDDSELLLPDDAGATTAGCDFSGK
jgi:hypothetical protein